jgi:uncharacterized protein YecE (DUF72 family)
MPLVVGTAGWTVPRQHVGLFPGSVESATLSHLERYATRLRGVEINSSFHLPHRRTTWERWAKSTPEGFRFAVKAPKAVTHESKLENVGTALQEFLDAVQALGKKLGPILFQLPPKLEYDAGAAQEFFSTVRELHQGGVVLEPRHASWFSIPAEQLLRSFEVARAAADPPKGSQSASEPGGWRGRSYWRLNGTPRTYYSDYEDDQLQSFAKRIREDACLLENETWVIFDNTALGHAAANAVRLDEVLRGELSN